MIKCNDVRLSSICAVFFKNSLNIEGKSWHEPFKKLRKVQASTKQTGPRAIAALLS